MLFSFQAFKDQEKPTVSSKDGPHPWFTFVSPNLFGESFDDVSLNVKSTQDLPNNTAIGLELIVLLAQPQPSWALIVKVSLYSLLIVIS